MRILFACIIVLAAISGTYVGHLRAQTDNCAASTSCGTCNHSLDGSPIGRMTSRQCFTSCPCTDQFGTTQSCRIETCDGCGQGTGKVYVSRCQTNILACQTANRVLCYGSC